MQRHSEQPFFSFFSLVLKNATVQPFLRACLKGAILFVLLYVSALLAYSYQPFATLEIYKGSVSWPPIGIGVAFLFLWGTRFWPIVFLAAFITNFQHINLWTSLGFAFGDIALVLISIAFLKKFHFRPQMDTLWDVIVITVFGAVIPAFFCPLIVLGVMYLHGDVKSLQEFFTIYQTLHLDEAVGVLNFGSLILIWSSWPPFWRGFFESIGLFVCATILPILMFSGINIPESAVHYLSVYLGFPILIWAALRFGMHGAILTSVYLQELSHVVSFVSVKFFHLSPSEPQAILSFEAFGGGMVTFSALFLAAAIAERRTMMESLKSASAASLKASVARSKFLSNMSHEIRTPLTGILGGIELLQKTALTDEQKRFIYLILSSAKPLIRIVNEILDLSMLESGKTKLKIEAIDLRDLVKEAVAAVSLDAKMKNLPIEVKIAEDVPDKILGDLRLHQILLNFLSNAVKYTDQGTVQIRLSKVSDLGNGMVHIKFEVIDSGIGISEEDRLHLFNPFMQFDLSRPQKMGFGLGLAITKQLVRLMDGEVGVYSQIGAGSTFWAEIPFEILRETQGKRELSPEQTQVFGSKKILVAEDNPINAQVMLMQLEKIGYSADLARDGNEALELLEKGTYDLILMDLTMPGRDGYSTTEEIRKREGGHKHTIIVAVTAHYLAGTEVDKVKMAGIDAILLKPVQMDQLRATLAKQFKLPATAAPQPWIGKMAPIDLDLLNELVSGDRKVLRFLVQSFFQNFQEDFAMLQSAVQNNNRLEIEHLSHKFTGSSGTMGCHVLSALFQTLNQLARENKLSEIPAIVQKIEEEMNGIQSYCKEKLE